MNETKTTPDVDVNDTGSIVMLTGRTEVGREWLKESVQSEPWQWMGPSLCVDHRFADDLIAVMQSDGLTVVLL